jgi:hypothetical protein
LAAYHNLILDWFVATKIWMSITPHQIFGSQYFGELFHHRLLAHELA